MITLDYYGFEGQGKTLKEAKADAGRKIERLRRGSWTPVFLRAGEYQALIWRDVSGWKSALLHDGKIGGTQCHDDIEPAEKSVRHHLAQLATDPHSCFAVEQVHPVCTDEHDRKDILWHCQWQRDYRQATDAGLDDHNARAFVGGFTNHMTVPVPECLLKKSAV